MASKLISKENSPTIRHFQGDGITRILEAIVDFSKITTALVAQNEVAEAIDIPANCRVNHVRAEVLTVEGAARNFAIGDGASTSGYITTQSANALAEFHTTLLLTEAAPNTVTGYTNGKYYATADTIDILAVTAGGLTTCRIKVSAEITQYLGT